MKKGKFGEKEKLRKKGRKRGRKEGNDGRGTKAKREEE